jgi:hypothetical protein
VVPAARSAWAICCSPPSPMLALKTLQIATSAVSDGEPPPIVPPPAVTGDEEATAGWLAVGTQNATPGVNRFAHPCRT